MLPFAGGLLAAGAVALSAYAAHGVEAAARTPMMLAAAFAFAHGLALAAIGRQAVRTSATIALVALLLGVLLFSGSLVAALWFNTSTRLAPVGGLLLIAGWLLYAVDALRS